MKVDCWSDPSVFEICAAEWEAIIPEERSDVLFVKPGWQKIWWQHLGAGDLTVLLVRSDGGDLRGVASWFIVDGTVHFVGCEDVVDYLDIIAQPEHIDEVAEALLTFMLSEDAPSWHTFDLCNIPEASPSREALAQAAEKLGLQTESTIQEVCPVITLPDTYEEYLESVDSKQRKELKRKRKRTSPYEVEWYIVNKDEHNLTEEMDAFFDMMAASTPEKAAFLKEPGHKALFRDVAHYTLDEGILDLIVLKMDGVRVAAMLQFGYGDRMLLYNSGLKPGKYGALSPGIVLLTYSIEDAINRGFTHYDFLRGDEEYKFRMGAEPTNIYNIKMSRA